MLLAAGYLGVRKLVNQPLRSGVGGRAEPGRTGPQQVAVLLNPVKARAAEALDLIVAGCAAAGWETPLVLETSREDPGSSQTRAAVAHGADVVLACGGDGTVRRVAEALAGSGVAMGLIPLGTGNLLARNLAMDVTDLGANVQTALFGDQRHIDTAGIQLHNAVTGRRAAYTFLVMAGIGFDAKMISDTRDELKKNVGWLAYGEAGVRHLPGRRTKVGISLDGGPVQQRKVRSVLFGNCGMLPGGIDFIPDAIIDDGVLDIVVLSPRSAIGWLAMLGKVLFRHRRGLPVLDYYRARSVQLSCQDPLDTQIDGDPSGAATSVTVRVAPQALLVRVRPTLPS